MPWRYIQRSGWLFEPSGHLLARGYSGRGDGRNNPALVATKKVGPIPVGEYTIEKPIPVGGKLGPCALPLKPALSNQMFKRRGFYAHGDSSEHPGQASEGCIILPLHVRQAMAKSPDRILEVVGDSQELNA